VSSSISVLRTEIPVVPGRSGTGAGSEVTGKGYARPNPTARAGGRSVGCEDVGVTRAELDKAPADVAAMFDGVAAKYDITNDVLSLGQTVRWRRAVRIAIDPHAGDRILDLAAGTGSSSEPLRSAGAYVVPCDFSLGMLEVGKSRLPTMPFTAGDALRLPFGDGVFDAATISFGLRNVADVDQALRELRRVTRVGGRLVVCEFSSPTNAVFRKVYLEYLMRALPQVARRVASNPEAYVYLAESIAAWPDQAALAQRVGAAGWMKVQWRNLNGGIVALHRAVAA
jgi:demethylmenaquinone methyltransferase/2-methoxy-6-polyprenyl-1,4-benzoquinol methylase